MIRPPPRPTLCPHTTLFRATHVIPKRRAKQYLRLQTIPEGEPREALSALLAHPNIRDDLKARVRTAVERQLERTTSDRKSTRLNSSHANISYAVFCLKKKTP